MVIRLQIVAARAGGRGGAGTAGVAAKRSAGVAARRSAEGAGRGGELGAGGGGGAAGVDPGKFAERWEERFQQLQAFKVQHGHCNIPQRWEENPPLGEWCLRQRRMKKEGSLSEDRQALLHVVGFQWDVRKEWEDRLGALAAYKAQAGDCNVPARWGEDPALGQWVSRQRRLYKVGSLDAAKVEVLDSMGFHWTLRKTVPKWESNLRLLENFREVHGHCRVEAGHDPELAAWVEKQRGYYRDGYKHALGPARVRKLEALGFDWD